MTKHPPSCMILSMDQPELKTIAELANLGLSDEELSSLGNEIEKLLDCFSKMHEADGDAHLSQNSGQPEENRQRRDERTGETSPDVFLENAPEREDRFFVIPNVL